MKSWSAAVLLFAGTLAFAQKKDPVLFPKRPAVGIKNSARSASPDIAAAALKTKSTTASDLARIEHGGGLGQSSRATTHNTNVQNYSRKNSSPTQSAKNKAMNASMPKHPGKPIPQVRRKTGKVG